MWGDLTPDLLYRNLFPDCPSPVERGEKMKAVSGNRDGFFLLGEYW